MDEILISIHLMLRFILTLFKKCKKHYAISIHLMLRFIMDTRTVVLVFLEFQYISCYGLSFTWTESVDTEDIFQYISCYGLSHIISSFVFVYCISIHLMLRFIYFLHGSYSFLTHFNTSHVTVYLKQL